MGSKKELSVERATKLLEPFAKRPPEGADRQTLYDTLGRLPAGLSMELVTKVLQQDAKAKKDRTGVARSLRAEYAPAVASVLRKYPREAASIFMLAALPANPAKWGTAHTELNTGMFWLSIYAMDRYRKNRASSLERYARDPRMMAGARAQIAKLAPDTSNHASLLLAHEGSKKSIDALEPAVKKLMKDPSNLDWLTYDLAPLLTKPAAKALQRLILGKTVKRNAASRGLQAGESLGLTGADSFRFKVAIYAKWSRIRLWFDSTKDPWYDAIWNWNELVALPRPKKSVTPLAELEAVFAHAMNGNDVVRALQGTKWERYELSSPHRGPFKKALDDWLAKQLPGITRTTKP